MVPLSLLIVILFELCSSTPFLSQVGSRTWVDVSLYTHCNATPRSLAGFLTFNPFAFAAAINTATTNTAAISTVFMSSNKQCTFRPRLMLCVGNQLFLSQQPRLHHVGNPRNLRVGYVITSRYVIWERDQGDDSARFRFYRQHSGEGSYYLWLAGSKKTTQRL